MGKKPSKGHSRDRPDFAFGLPDLNDRQLLRDAVLQRAHLCGTSCLPVELSAGLLRSERQALLRQFPTACKKVAIVAMGEPSDAFKQWVRNQIKSQHETKVAMVQKRKYVAEAKSRFSSPHWTRTPHLRTLCLVLRSTVVTVAAVFRLGTSRRVLASLDLQQRLKAANQDHQK